MVLVPLESGFSSVQGLSHDLNPIGVTNLQIISAFPVAQILIRLAFLIFMAYRPGREISADLGIIRVFSAACEFTFLNVDGTAAVLAVHFPHFQHILCACIQIAGKLEIFAIPSIVMIGKFLAIYSLEIGVCIVIGFCVKSIVAIRFRTKRESSPPGFIRKCRGAGVIDANRSRSQLGALCHVDLTEDLHHIAPGVPDLAEELIPLLLVHDSLEGG